MSVCPNILAMDSKETLFAIASDANVCLTICVEKILLNTTYISYFFQ